MKMFKIAFWRLYQGGAGEEIRTKKQRIQHRLQSINRNELAEDKGTSLQSPTASCRLQREQNFNTNSILSTLTSLQ